MKPGEVKNKVKFEEFKEIKLTNRKITRGTEKRKISIEKWSRKLE